MQNSVRYHELDFARAILMILGVFYHSSLIYRPLSTWTAVHHESHVWFSYFSTFSASFRMPAFFIIAGFFYLLILKKKGIINGMKDRLIRLFIPMIFIGFTLNYVPNLLSENYAFPNTVYEYVRSGDWLRHTWFLGNLICYCIVCAAVLNIKIFSRVWEKVFSWKLMLFFVLLLPAVIALIKDQTWRLTGYDNYFFITSKYLLVFFPYFILGMFIYAQKDILLRYITLPVTVFCFIFSLMFLSLMVVFPEMDKSFYLIIKQYLTLFLCIGMICFLSLSSTIFNQKLVRKVADSSYTIYLLHSPLIIALYYLIFSTSNMNIFGQYAIICSSTLLVSYFFHNYVVNKVKFLALLINGKFLRDTNNR